MRLRERAKVGGVRKGWKRVRKGPEGKVFTGVFVSIKTELA